MKISALNCSIHAKCNYEEQVVGKERRQGRASTRGGNQHAATARRRNCQCWCGASRGTLWLLSVLPVAAASHRKSKISMSVVHTYLHHPDVVVQKMSDLRQLLVQSLRQGRTGIRHRACGCIDPHLWPRLIPNLSREFVSTHFKLQL